MRNTVYGVLYDFYKYETYLNLSLKKLEKDFINQITIRVYGIVQHDFYLNYLIEKYVDTKIDFKSKIILKMSFFEVLYLDSIPDYAVISEMINLCKVKIPSKKGYITYILKNKLEEIKKDELCYKNEAKNLSLKYSIPQFLVKKIMLQYPIEYKLILQDTERRKTTYCRNLDVQIPASCTSVYSDLVVCNVNPLSLEEFKLNKLVIQDFGAYLVGKICGRIPGAEALDICAAPGNKTQQLAKSFENVTANEINNSRYKLLLENMEKYKINNVICINKDACELENFKEMKNHYDLVLVDAPCSGTGVFKSKPDLKINLTKEKIDLVLIIQEKILSVAAELVKENGILIYSTCSINKDENEKQMTNFLRDKNFKEQSIGEFEKFFEKGELGYTMLPHKFNSDGFYICKLKKEKNEK